ncbi:MAG TPA: transketolase [Candidatus Baltobacteraceae bacterium]|nr:transketolase [Candidatus Baltobacteraceae bacterium]
MPESSLVDRSINTIRMLAVDGVQQAKSGHPGLPMGAAAMAYVLWTRLLRHNPADPKWPDRDRFVLSAGHGSMLLYALLHLTGYDLSLEELKRFRQLGSKTPGHPECGHTPGVEATTGPLGQGVAMGVGMAIAERWLAATFNRPDHPIVDHAIYGIVSDGDLMEGISSEAASLAGHLRLGKLIYLYDDNHISIDGQTGLAFTEDVGKRFEGFHWHVQRVADGNDLAAVEAAIHAARREADRPSLIMCSTHIGYGSPHKQDTSKAHGEPLGEDEVRLTKQHLGWPESPAFLVPDDVRAEFRKALERGKVLQSEWKGRFERYRQAYPAEAARWQEFQAGTLPAGWEEALPTFKAEDPAIATRAASGKVLHAIYPKVLNLIGGSADLAPSNNTYVPGAGEFQAGSPGGRNFHFGVREHAMAAVGNGMALHGGVRPYVATFLIFSDYMRPAIRLAALMQTHLTFVFTHDSIGLGEDGPTHQPIEHLMSLRAIPGLRVIRPADAVETVEAWKVALTEKGPTCLILTRQNLPILSRTGAEANTGVVRGAYILADAPDSRPEALLLATGSEVALAVAARTELEKRGVAARVVSMPCWELFEAQPEAYRTHVLPPTIRARVAVEAGSPLGWYKYVGMDGAILGITRFGASAPAKVLFEQFGFTPQHIVEETLRLFGR